VAADRLDQHALGHELERDRLRDATFLGGLGTGDAVVRRVRLEHAG
jgi:hypothetical protein